MGKSLYLQTPSTPNVKNDGTADGLALQFLLSGITSLEGLALGEGALESFMKHANSHSCADGTTTGIAPEAASGPKTTDQPELHRRILEGPMSHASEGASGDSPRRFRC
jgi:hypothetical protein